MPQDIEFFMPYPPRVATDLSTALVRHLEWASQQGFLQSDAATERYRFSQHAEVGAWFCPDPGDSGDLDLQLDVNGWYFVFDDAFDVPAGQSADGAVAVCQELMELVREDRRPYANSSPLVTAFADIWQRECEAMTTFWRQRASSTWADYLSGNLVEEANRRLKAPLTPDEYLSVRRRSVGVLPGFDMRECIGPCEVPTLAWYSSHLQTMRLSTVEHVIMVNDVCSLEKDEARGETNLVSILCEQQACAREAAIREVVSMADARMRRFRALYQGLPQLCRQLALNSKESTAVSRHAEAMIDMLSGNYYWSRSCGRYSHTAAACLAPDRPGLLALHDLT
ncbi:terpene synthase family protein [Streptomyces spectabilis]|uniref:Terpene synthase n=1 Tax=Streptomyces spectabilis TaxID=68270 RepID=A0A7W8B3Z8_STRST|nr:hypothetical protein [Streptomyces spectabilis]MBB5109893.1 pentalenene synthase [Streptomyces spectabilis]GGV56919.1 hypothetical protein GCM10010245_89960 [Streptomyces spectabilis]